MSTTRTLRIEKDLDEAMQKLAKAEGVSVNQLASTALRKYIDWDEASVKTGLVSVPSELLVKLMDTQSIEEARALGRWAGADLFSPYIEYLFAKINLSTAIEGLSMLSRYGSRFSFDHSAEGEKHVIMLRQTMGPKWSSYYAGALEGIFEDRIGKKIKVTVNPHICIAEFTN